MSTSGALLEHGGSPFADLARHGGATAVVTRDVSLSYAELAGRVAERSERLGPVRRLVLVRCRNDVETLVTYLAALNGGHVVLLAGCNGEAVSRHYEPDVVADGSHLEQRHEGTRHELHPDLAVLMSTSGSTGSPKLVRLSHENLRSNAASIATYLAITPRDRAATTLPLHYCYGLSVVNSHLLTGASLLITDRSVVTEEFWDDFTEHGATSLAGVPYTFELLDSSGFAERRLPTLRCLTQAGGRMPPETVRRFARLGRERDFELFVMYGQTEATARMAYLPPHLAEDRPESIGIPIPGGSFHIAEDAALGSEGVGELVYTGPNVMLGYATEAADLRAGREVHELRTGDLARQHEDGLFELVGRTSRFAKVFGLRIDLDRLEQLAADAGMATRAVEHDGSVHVFGERRLPSAELDRLADRCGLPRHALRAHQVAALPLTESGKPDYASLTRHAALVQAPPSDPGRRAGEVTPEAVRDLYAELLGRPDATIRSSFIGLRGDSLSYVELSIRLEDLLGRLPSDWPTRSAAELARRQESPAGRSRGVRMDTSILLRCLAIGLVVATHANLISVMGGAHLMLGLVGFNLARFQLADQPRRERVRGLLRAAAQIAVPSAVWILGVGLVTGMYEPWTALMLNAFVGSDDWDVQWQFWFLEAVVWSQVGVAALMSSRRVAAVERRRPFEFAVGVLAATLALRYLLVGVAAGPTDRYAVAVVLWSIALGWLIARCTTVRQRLVTSALAAASTYGFFGDLTREALIVAGLLLLTWVPHVTVPRAVGRVVVVVAGASLFVYLTHWQVYPHLEVNHPLMATVLSFGVGVAAWKGYCAVTARWARVWHWLTQPAGRGAAGEPGRDVSARPGPKGVGRCREPAR